MSKNKLYSLFLISSASVLLGACSTMINGSTQQIAFKTLGADDATCEVKLGTNEYRYVTHPPQTLWIQRTRKPMFITCTAPGNRVQTVTVESTVAGATVLNGASAGLTLPWDAASGAMYKYPNEVVVDFTGVTAKDRPLPAYENRGALAPSEQGIEDMGPENPKLPTDDALAARYKASYAESSRLEAEQAAIEAEKQRRIDSLDGGFYGDKGHSTKTEKKTNEVQIAPLSEAIPAPSKTGAVESQEIIVPSVQPKLAQPIFPSSNTF